MGIYTAAMQQKTNNPDAISFTSMLLSANHSDRMAIETAVSHPFIVGSSNSNTDKAEGGKELKLNPVELHFTTPPIVILPEIDETSVSRCVWKAILLL